MPMGKHQKVEVNERLRFCKVVVKDGEEEDDKFHEVDSDISVAGSEFDSPTPVKNDGNKYDDGDKIRDSLSNIMSRLKILSIEKGRHPIKQLPNSSDSVINEKFNQQKPGGIFSSNPKVFNENTFPEFQILNKNINNSTSGDELPFSLSDPKFNFLLPSKIANMLYPYQREGLKWLWSLHCKGKGGILGDDMGLGKTMQMCSFLAGLFHSNLIKRVLIIAPKTLQPHWMKELGVVGLSEKTGVFFGTCAEAQQYQLQHILQDNGVLLTTYDIVRNNVKSLSGDHEKMEEDAITWDYMILDEGHLIKNSSTQRAQSLLNIPCGIRIIMSGTLLQNNLKEMWALFNFCCPGLLGDKICFKHKYELEIRRGNYKKASDENKRRGLVAAKDLRNCIQPYFLRRLKSEVFGDDHATNTAKLSKKNEITVWLRLSGCQRHLYEAFLNRKIDSPLAALSILKKICDHPLLLTKREVKDVLKGLKSVLNPEDHEVIEKSAMHIADAAERYDTGENHEILSCKISFIMSLMGNLIPEGHKVLIFSQSCIMLDLIQDTLNAKGYKFLRMDGTTKYSERLKIVHGVGAPIFLLTTRVGGLGLTLTKADRVIVVDPDWNPSTDNQSVDRAYRIGQKKDVIVYRLMTCGTIEEKIYIKQIYKGGLFKSATEDKEQIRYFDYWDLKELFSLPEQGFDVSLTQQQLHKEHDSEHEMDSSLEAHIKFLESLGIAGISHHSLLFSKTAPVPVMQDFELRRIMQSMYPDNSFSHSTSARYMDARSRFSFNLGDYAMKRKNLSGCISNNLPESEIKHRIKLSNIFANKKAYPGPFVMRNHSWEQRRTSTIFGVKEACNESGTGPSVLKADSEVRNQSWAHISDSLNLLQNGSRTRPSVLKVNSKANVETGIASTSWDIIQRVRKWFQTYRRK
ncbi:unnamed protein product [Lactuca virosa]|uniref:Uncharacterized protein n=1 Tax=Lactuca virosa TaxID=75947 RepID=A0AAU9LCR3_9ASTR|nr:unnamed protein product [Lactuca virosa]